MDKEARQVLKALYRCLKMLAKFFDLILKGEGDKI